MSGNLVFLDCETTSLDPTRGEVVEVAYAVGTGDVITLRTPHSLYRADSKALEINRYYERGLNDVNTWCSEEDEYALKDALSNATLVGANPAFDASFLNARWGYSPWHYRLLDVEAYAAGYFGWIAPFGLKGLADWLSEVHGFTPSSPDHTAAADVVTVREIYYWLHARPRPDNYNLTLPVTSRLAGGVWPAGVTLSPAGDA